MDAAEDDVLGLGLGGDAGQAEGITTGVGPGHYLVALVVVAQDEDLAPERGLGGPCPLHQTRV